MKQKLYITTALVLIILLVINLLSNEFYMRLDFTDSKQYTLSQATVDILNDLEDPVTVKAYFSKDLPPTISKTRQDFQEMLVEYASLSDGMLLYEFKNPNKDKKSEEEATSQGVQAVLINVREKDQVKQQKAFLGAIVSTGDRSEVIPFMKPGVAMEYALSTAIKKISLEQKPSIGFVKGHGEPPLEELMQLETQLSVLYESKEIELETAPIDPTIKALVIIRPTDSISPTALARIDDFLAQGGRLAIAMNKVAGSLQTLRGYTLNTNLGEWLEQKGIVIENNFVVDVSCGAVTVNQQQGFFTMRTNVPFPYIPIIKNFADHPITVGLENVMFEFASTIHYSGDSANRFTPLAFSSDKSNALAAPVYFDIQKQWQDADLPLQRLPIVAAIEGPIARGKSTKMVVIADGDFVINGKPQQSRNLQQDNINLLSNAIDWLADDTGLIELRTKGVTSRPIDNMEDSTKTILKYANFAAPILLAIAYGLVRMQRTRIKRLKRASENYEDV